MPYIEGAPRGADTSAYLLTSYRHIRATDAAYPHGYNTDSVRPPLRDTVVDDGAEPTDHQGCWTLDRHGPIGLQQGFLQGATWEMAKQTVTVENARTTLNWIEAFLGDCTQSIIVNWLSLHHCQRDLLRYTGHSPMPFALSIVHQWPRLSGILYYPYHWRPGIGMERDLSTLQTCNELLGTHFNAKKCNVMTLARGADSLSHFYQLNNTRVNSYDYLGIAISENLSWTDHITANAKKANIWLGFLCWNLKGWPQDPKQTAYMSFVHSLMEYSSNIWNPICVRTKMPWRKYSAEQHDGSEVTSASGHVS